MEEIQEMLKVIQGRLDRLEYAVLTPEHKQSWGVFYPSDQDGFFPKTPEETNEQAR